MDVSSIKYRNAVYNKYGGIDCQIFDEEFEEWVNYTASPKINKNDKAGRNRLIFERIQREGSVAPYVPRKVPLEYYINYAKAERDRLLLSSDWSQLPDIPQEVKAKWITYRQNLRDITDQPGFPMEINWPSTDPDGKPTYVNWPPKVD